MPITATELGVLLGPWHQGTGALYAQLARALARLLDAGQIGSGTALPAERQLAAALAISRTTVTAAYAELRREGRVSSRQGSATVVNGSHRSAVAAYKTNGLFSTLMRSHPEVLDLTVAVPAAAPVVAEVMAQPSLYLDPSSFAEGHGYLPMGYGPLRESLARVLTANGLPTAPDELLITSGAHQALSIAMDSRLRPGDTALVEEVTYPGALDLASARGAQLVGVPTSTDGVEVGALRQAVVDTKPALVYVIPTFHNPTGALLDRVGREHLARTVDEAGVATIDDLTLAELDYLEPAPPPLAALRPDAPIISVGSMSKVFWGGLRIGWLRAAIPVIEHLVGFKTAADLGTSTIAQTLATAMLTRYDETRAWRKAELAHSLEVLTNEIDDRLPGWGWQPPAGGPHLWVEMPPGADATAFAQAALWEGVALLPGALLAVSDEHAPNRIRLPLYPGSGELVRAVGLMAHTWESRQRPRAS